MALMNKMREITKSVLWIVIVAFIGTIVFAWGMGSFQDASPVRRGVIGMVNDHEISANYFMQLYEEEYSKAIEESPDGEVSEERAKELRDEVWNKLVYELLMADLREKLGIAVSDKELVEFMQRYPLPELRQNPALQTDGEFDYNKYMSALMDPSINWLPIENYARNQLASLKMQRMSIMPYYTTEDDIRRAFADDHITLNLEYLAIPSPEDLQGYEPTEEEIQQYYDENATDLAMVKRPEQKVVLTYAQFWKPLNESYRDSVINELKDLRARVVGGEDFAKLADEYNQDETSGEGGSLPWTKEGEFVKEFNEAIKGLGEGDLSEPFRTPFGYHLVRVDEIREFDDKQTGTKKKNIKARHIMYGLDESDEERTLLMAGLTELRDVEDEEEFIRKAREFGGEVTVKDSINRTSRFEFAGQAASDLSRFSFTNDPGTVSEPLENSRGYLVAYISDVIKPDVPSLEQVRGDIVNILKGMRGVDFAEEEGREFLEQLKSPDQFRPLARSKGYKIYREPEFKKTKFVRQAAGDTPRFAAAAFSLTTENPISEPVRGRGGVYVIHLLERSEFDEDLYQAQRDSIFQKIATEKQNKLFQNWYQKLYENAKIEDYRSEFYTET
ncbi:MAG: hypothetical protein GF307_00795 [candidate division Zixibacteria bacterium]|nr:hypothetical protein [candidate division Zixibacteria bacterium]